MQGAPAGAMVVTFQVVQTRSIRPGVPDSGGVPVTGASRVNDIGAAAVPEDFWSRLNEFQRPALLADVIHSRENSRHGTRGRRVAYAARHGELLAQGRRTGLLRADTSDEIGLPLLRSHPQTATPLLAAGGVKTPDPEKPSMY